MKKVILLLLSSILFFNAQSQESNTKDVNRLFAGGSLVLGYSGGSANSSGDYNYATLTLGGNPEIGYSISKNFDIGICGNLIYANTRYRPTISSNLVKQNVFNYGAGIFARLHITDGFFLQAQPEANTIKYKVTADGVSHAIEEGKYPSTSFLVGFGYGNHVIGETSFFTLILFDTKSDPYSPYRSNSGGIAPIIRAGFNFYFKSSKKK